MNKTLFLYDFAATTTKVNRKARRKPMSERYTCKKEWNKEDAMKALTLENAYNHLIKKVPMLILRFPDPELNKALIHSYSPAIETVHFQQPSRARWEHFQQLHVSVFFRFLLKTIFVVADIVSFSWNQNPISKKWRRKFHKSISAPAKYP